LQLANFRKDRTATPIPAIQQMVYACATIGLNGGDSLSKSCTQGNRPAGYSRCLQKGALCDCATSVPSEIDAFAEIILEFAQMGRAEKVLSRCQIADANSSANAGFFPG